MRFLERLCIESWWVLLCLLLMLIVYERSSSWRQEELTRLKGQLEALERDKAEAVALFVDLTLQINSQSDPEWVELVLRKGLGLVPEKQTKVFFDHRR